MYRFVRLPDPPGLWERRPAVPDERRSAGFCVAARSHLEFAGAWTLILTLRALPYRISVALAELLGLALGCAIPKWRQVAEDNLQRALPDLSSGERKRIRKGVFRNLGRVAFALAKLPAWSARTVRKHVAFTGLEHYHAARAKGRGVLLLTAHLGNWELGAIAHAAAVAPFHVMVRPIENPRVDSLVESLRRSHGNSVIAKRNAAREVLRVLASNGTVGILADQNTVREEAVFVELFGMTASANKGLARLALCSGAAVVPAIARWDADSKTHVVEYAPEVAIVRTDSPARDIETNSQRFQLAIEDRIRRYPDQWLWIHRRWKTQPPGQ